MEVTNTRRIVLLGKTGSGKSSLANTIFGERNVFTVSSSPNSETKLCESHKDNIYGRNIQLIDTPGLFDTDPRSTELSPELLRCITKCSPGPHAFLLVLKVERYTKLEQAVVAVIRKYFSEEALKYTTVVFTYGDNLPEGMKIEEWVRQNEALRNLVQKCGGRCHVFDNKHWNNSQDQYRNNQYQVQELLKTIDKTVRENKGGYYTNEFIQEVQRMIQDAEGRKKSRNNHEFRIKILKVAAIGALLGAFLGVGGLALFAKKTITCAMICGAAAKGAAAGGAVGTVGGFVWACASSSGTGDSYDETFMKELQSLIKKYE